MIHLDISMEQLHNVLSWSLIDVDVHHYTVELWPVNGWHGLNFRDWRQYSAAPVTVLRSEND